MEKFSRFWPVTSASLLCRQRSATATAVVQTKWQNFTRSGQIWPKLRPNQIAGMAKAILAIQYFTLMLLVHYYLSLQGRGMLQSVTLILWWIFSSLTFMCLHLSRSGYILILIHWNCIFKIYLKTNMILHNFEPHEPILILRGFPATNINYIFH